jgi:hypothetical protein
MTGSTEDPKDGPAVAATVFGVMAVYGVSATATQHSYQMESKLINIIPPGFSSLLEDQPTQGFPYGSSAQGGAGLDGGRTETAER